MVNWGISSGINLSPLSPRSSSLKLNNVQISCGIVLIWFCPRYSSVKLVFFPISFGIVSIWLILLNEGWVSSVCVFFLFTKDWASSNWSNCKSHSGSSWFDSPEEKVETNWVNWQSQSESVRVDSSCWLGGEYLVFVSVSFLYPTLSSVKLVKLLISIGSCLIWLCQRSKWVKLDNKEMVTGITWIWWL